MSEVLQTPPVHNPERAVVRAARGTTEFMDNIADKIDAFATRWTKRPTLSQTVSNGAESVKDTAYNRAYELQETFLTKKGEAGEWIDSKVEAVKDTGSRAIETVVSTKDAAKELFENFRTGVRERKAARHERWALRRTEIAATGKEFTTRQAKRVGRGALIGVGATIAGAQKARAGTQRGINNSLDAYDMFAAERAKAKANAAEQRAIDLRKKADAHLSNVPH